jgi:hypothetical protein
MASSGVAGLVAGLQAQLATAARALASEQARSSKLARALRLCRSIEPCHCLVVKYATEALAEYEGGEP